MFTTLSGFLSGFTFYDLPYGVTTTDTSSAFISISDYIIPDYTFTNYTYNKFISTSIYGNFNVLPDISGSLSANAYFCSNVSISGNLYVNGALITGGLDYYNKIIQVNSYYSNKPVGLANIVAWYDPNQVIMSGESVIGWANQIIANSALDMTVANAVSIIPYPNNNLLNMLNFTTRSSYIYTPNKALMRGFIAVIYSTSTAQLNYLITPNGITADNSFRCPVISGLYGLGGNDIQVGTGGQVDFNGTTYYLYGSTNNSYNNVGKYVIVYCKMGIGNGYTGYSLTKTLQACLGSTVSNSSFVGYIGDFICLSPNHTESDVQTLVVYLGDKWGLTSSLPLSYPAYIEKTLNNATTNTLAPTTVYGNFNILPEINSIDIPIVNIVGNVGISGNLYINNALITPTSTIIPNIDFKYTTLSNNINTNYFTLGSQINGVNSNLDFRYTTLSNNINSVYYTYGSKINGINPNIDLRYITLSNNINSVYYTLGSQINSINNAVVNPTSINSNIDLHYITLSNNINTNYFTLGSQINSINNAVGNPTTINANIDLHYITLSNNINSVYYTYGAQLNNKASLTTTNNTFTNSNQFNNPISTTTIDTGYADSTRESNAGKIWYKPWFNTNALCLVGAGTAAGNRSIKLYDNVNIFGSLTFEDGTSASSFSSFSNPTMINSNIDLHYITLSNNIKTNYYTLGSQINNKASLTTTNNIFTNSNQFNNAVLTTVIDTGYADGTNRDENAGKIWYKPPYNTNVLSIVGAGSVYGSRNIQLWDNVKIMGNLSFSDETSASSFSTINANIDLHYITLSNNIKAQINTVNTSLLNCLTSTVRTNVSFYDSFNNLVCAIMPNTGSSLFGKIKLYNDARIEGITSSLPISECNEYVPTTRWIRQLTPAMYSVMYGLNPITFSIAHTDRIYGVGNYSLNYILAPGTKVVFYTGGNFTGSVATVDNSLFGPSPYNQWKYYSTGTAYYSFKVYINISDSNNEYFLLPTADGTIYSF